MRGESQVNGLLSRCILDPAFLELLASAPDSALAGALPPGGIYRDFVALDKERLRRFAGFIAKVQHNYLWELFPATRRALRFLGLEARVFQAYAARHQDLRRRQGIGQAEKARAFLDFLEEFLAGLGPSGARLLDLAVHERLQWETGAAAVPPGEPAAGPARLGAGRVAIRGVLRLREFSFDPEALLEGATSAARFEQVPASPVILAYWAAGGFEGVRVLSVDALTAFLLSEINGCRTFRTIRRRVAGRYPGLIGRGVLRSAMASLLSAGLVTVHRSSSSSNASSG